MVVSELANRLQSLSTTATQLVPGLKETTTPAVTQDPSVIAIQLIEESADN
jgi:hypothetical protein